MSFKVHTVVNGNTPQNEFVWLHATEALNVKGYALVDRTFDSKDQVSNEFRHIFVFPNLVLKKNDWICLHSGTGKYNTEINSHNTITHHLYWQSDKCIWNNNDKDTASLIQYNFINSCKVSTTTK